MKTKNVLFYAVNGLGMGHLTRLLSIARKMVEKDESINPIFITTSEACEVLYKHNIMYYKLPSKSYLKLNKKIRRRDLQMMYNTTVMNLVNTYNPIALIVDTFPTGSLDDLLGVLSMKSPMKKIFIHREQKKMSNNQIMLQNFYDLIITPHMKDTTVIPVPRGKPLDWVGNIMVRSKDETFTKEEVIKKLKLPTDKKIVLLNLGGGGDLTTITEYKIIIDKLGHRKDLFFIVPEAPLKKFELELADNMMSISYYPLIEIMNVFDAAISATGYNTFHELNYMGVPTIFIPKLRGLDDQESRARSIDNKSGFCILETELEADLETKFQLLLDNRDSFSQYGQNLVTFNGAERAADSVLNLISPQCNNILVQGSFDRLDSEEEILSISRSSLG